MMTDALLAFFHYSAIFVLFAFLTVEAMLLRNPLDANTVRLIARVDLWFFGAALLTLVSGLMRLFWGAKGSVSIRPIRYFMSRRVYLSPSACFHFRQRCDISVGQGSSRPTQISCHPNRSGDWCAAWS